MSCPFLYPSVDKKYSLQTVTWLMTSLGKVYILEHFRKGFSLFVDFLLRFTGHGLTVPSNHNWWSWSIFQYSAWISNRRFSGICLKHSCLQHRLGIYGWVSCKFFRLRELLLSACAFKCLNGTASTTVLTIPERITGMWAREYLLEWNVH